MFAFGGQEIFRQLLINKQSEIVCNTIQEIFVQTFFKKFVEFEAKPQGLHS